MVSCAVLGCNSTKKNNPQDYSFHRFPVNPDIREKWLRMLNRPNWTPQKNSTICSKHFQDHCFSAMGKERQWLRSGSVPTISMPIEVKLPRRVTMYRYRDIEPVPSTSVKLSNRKKKMLKTTTLKRSITGKEKERKNNLPIIAKVYLYLEKEYEYMKTLNGNNCDLSPLADILKRTAEATGVNEEKVIDILKIHNLECHLPERIKRKRKKSPEKHSEVIRCDSDANNTSIKKDQPLVKSDVSRCQEGTLYLEVSPIPLKYRSNNESVTSCVETNKVKAEPNSDKETMSAQSVKLEDFLDSELNDEYIPDPDKNSHKSYDGVEYLDEEFEYLDEDNKMDIEQYSYTGDKPRLTDPPPTVDTSCDSLNTEIKLELEDD